MIPKEFIEVTAQYDGRKAIIRSACIEAVTDNAEQKDGETIRLESRTIYYSGHTINVLESYDDILNMIWNAEL